jgi:bacillithiol system protein YtxJ
MAGLTAVLFLGASLVSTAAEPEKKAPGLSINQRALEEAKDKLTAPTQAPNDGTEKGNLKEVGAREILTIADYERAVAMSKEQPVLIFKHSTECPVSGGAYRRVSAWLNEAGSKAPATFLVKVIERKPVSQAIAARSGIVHESPQSLLFQHGKPVWDADHEAITGEAIRAALAAHKPKE